MTMSLFAPAATTRAVQPLSASAARSHIGLTDRWFMLLLLALGALPLLWPIVPPLTDLPNHMSRYRVALDHATSPYLGQWFDHHWVLVGNLGVDLLVAGLAPLIGLEPATKLVVMLTPVVAIGGLGLIAREVHGHVPRITAFAAVFAYNFPFNFGFVNFTLSAALALAAFGLWLRLGRAGATRLRAMVFAGVGFIVWLAHAAGWGILGLLIFSWEVADAHARNVGIPRAIGRATVACLPLTLPLLPMLAWSAAVPHGSLGVFILDPIRKLAIVFLALRNGIPLIDVTSMLLLWGVALIALIRVDLGYDRRLAACGLVLFAAYAAMPALLMGSGHADVRIAPYAAMIVMLAIRPEAATAYTRRLGVIAIAFFAGQMGYHAIRYATMAAAQEHSLEALNHLPEGSTVFALSSVGCSAEMDGNRMDHVHRLAVVRRQAFTNGNWPYPAVQTMTVRPDMIAGYTDESSQLLEPRSCRGSFDHMVRGALRSIPRDRYRYFWLLDTPRELWPTRSWLRPIWHNDRTILYAIAPPRRRWNEASDRMSARRLPIDPA